MEGAGSSYHAEGISKNARAQVSEIALKTVMAENFWAGLSGYLRLTQPAPRKDIDTGSSIKDVEDDSKRKSRFLATLGMTVRGTLADSYQRGKTASGYGLRLTWAATMESDIGRCSDKPRMSSSHPFSSNSPTHS